MIGTATPPDSAALTPTQRLLGDAVSTTAHAASVRTVDEVAEPVAPCHLAPVRIMAEAAGSTTAVPPMRVSAGPALHRARHLRTSLPILPRSTERGRHRDTPFPVIPALKGSQR